MIEAILPFSQKLRSQASVRQYLAGKLAQKWSPVFVSSELPEKTNAARQK